MAKPYFLKRTEQFFKTQKALKEALKNIKDSYEKGEYIEDTIHCLILKDFIEEIHKDNQEILADFSLDNCRFYVDDSEDYPTKCIYIVDGEDDDKKRSFSVRNLEPPSYKSNFSQRCSHVIRPIKAEKKREMIDEQNLEGDIKDFLLLHVKPEFSKIVNDFISENFLSEKLEEIVSKNGENLNVPEFVGEYEYLNNKFIEYYQSLIPSIVYNLTKKET